MTHDLIVIGAGSAGLTAAGGAAMFGLKVALIERGEMGGECLHTGCVPSKSLIAAAARAQTARAIETMGITLARPQVAMTGVRAHIRAAIAAIAPHDSQERFEGMGIEVIRAPATFLDDRTLQAGNRRLSAPRIVIATGSRPAIPPIEGIADIPYLTNETLFDLGDLPDRLLIVGGGAMGCEMAQAFVRLGSEVTVIQNGKPLAKEDPDAAALVIARLEAEGVTFVADADVARAERDDAGVRLTLANGRALGGSHLLLATGRRAAIDDLDLDAAGIRRVDDGIHVDGRRRTSNKRIFAIGDCRAGPRFTHVAGYEGSLVALQVATGWPSSVEWSALPRVTYTDPELAQIGLTEQEARDRHGDIEVNREDFADNDRAVTEGNTDGFTKMIRHRGKVVGVTVVGARAGDLLLPWAQIITGKASTFALGSAIVAYPTRSDIAKAVAFAAWSPKVFGTVPRIWARTLAKLRR